MFIGELRCLQERKCGHMGYLQERYVKDVSRAVQTWWDVELYLPGTKQY